MSEPALDVVGPAEAASIAEIHACCFADEPWEAAGLGRMLRDPACLCVAGRSRGRLTGFVLCRVAADECEILSCAVDPLARGRGLARRLLEAALAEATRRGARRVFLEVDEENASARGLYAAVGMRQVGRRRGYYIHRRRPPSDALVMTRDL